MKRVISNEELNCIYTKDVSTLKEYGLVDHEGKKGFIARAGQRTGVYNCYSSTGLIIGEIWHQSNTIPSELGSMFEYLLQVNYKIYEFDSSKELFKWLSND